MAISSVMNHFVKLFIIRNKLLYHQSQQKSVQLHFNHKKVVVFPESVVWFALLRLLFSNDVSTWQDLAGHLQECSRQTLFQHEVFR